MGHLFVLYMRPSDYLRPQQTRDIHPMLNQCWASVIEGGPTLGGCLVFVGSCHCTSQTRSDSFFEIDQSRLQPSRRKSIMCRDMKLFKL